LGVTKTLALRPMNKEDRGGNRVINMSVSVLSGNFGIKQILSQNLGACVNPNFGKSGNCQWACFEEGGTTG
jgi:hypothetical protein